MRVCPIQNSAPLDPDRSGNKILCVIISWALLSSSMIFSLDYLPPIHENLKSSSPLDVYGHEKILSFHLTKMKNKNVLQQCEKFKMCPKVLKLCTRHFLFTCGFIGNSQNKSCSAAVNHVCYIKSYKTWMLRSRIKALWLRIETLPHKRVQSHWCSDFPRIIVVNTFMRLGAMHKAKIAFMRRNSAFLPHKEVEPEFIYFQAKQSKVLIFQQLSIIIYPLNRDSIVDYRRTVLTH